MGIFKNLFKGKGTLKQDLSDKQQPGGLFIIHLLFEEKCGMPDRELMKSVMDKHIGENELFTYNETTAGFSAKKYTVWFKDGAVPPMLMITGCTEITDWQPDALTMSQMWDCPEKDEIFEKCRYQVVAADMMGAGVPYKSRADMLMDFTEALLEMFPECRAVMFDTSGKMFTREAFLGREIPREDRFVYFAVNVRFFNIEGTEDMLVDTLGMGTLFLPDLQYHFHGMDQNAVVNHAYNTLSYIYANECPIKSGDTIDGIRDGGICRDIQWKCQFENSLIQPLREVIDVHMGELASGGRK
ncbi:MAG: DUF4261 domain-containing protein [Oscillospiraceae bacterium]|nr:DUF4261 domain-containing protein [Oscillospiraceae bacterium]